MLIRNPRLTVQENVIAAYPEDAAVVQDFPEDILLSLYPEFRFGAAGREVVEALDLLHKIVEEEEAKNNSIKEGVLSELTDSFDDFTRIVADSYVIIPSLFRPIYIETFGLGKYVGCEWGARLIGEAIVMKAEVDWEISERNTAVENVMTEMLEKWERVKTNHLKAKAADDD